MPHVKLKNGAEELDLNVNKVMDQLQIVFNEKSDADTVKSAANLVDFCNGKAEILDEKIVDYFHRIGLMRKDTQILPERTVNVILSAFKKDGDIVIMTSPIEGDNNINYGFNQQYAL